MTHRLLARYTLKCIPARPSLQAFYVKDHDMPYRRLFVINVETINLLTQIPNRFYVIKEQPETMITTVYLFSFLGSALSPAISACVEYQNIIQRLKRLVYKDYVLKL